ncbi:MAG: metallophosphoesterase [Acidimicrobiia bacterium]
MEKRGSPHSRYRRIFGLLVAGVLLAGCSSPATTTSTPAVTVTTLPSPTTAPPVPTTTSSETVSPEEHPGDLIVVGDWGSGTVSQTEVAVAMSAYAADHDVAAILTTGDNFYSDDATSLSAPFDWAFADQVPFWVTWGNHDIESERRIAAIDLMFGNPPRWVTHRWGAVDVVILDSNQITSPSQARFFLSEMLASTRPAIVALHHPPYSCSHHGSTTDVVNSMVQLLDDDVVMVVAGHDHNYQRFESSGVSYVVSGGGGRALYDLQDCPANHPPMIAGAAIHHFVVLHQEGKSMSLNAIDIDGDVFDSVSIPLP